MSPDDLNVLDELNYEPIIDNELSNEVGDKEWELVELELFNAL